MRSRWFTPSEPKARRELRRWADRIEDAPDGKQNIAINLSAFILAKDFCPPLDPEEIRQELLDAAERGNHPHHRAQSTIDHAA